MNHLVMGWNIFIYFESKIIERWAFLYKIKKIYIEWFFVILWCILDLDLIPILTLFLLASILWKGFICLYCKKWIPLISFQSLYQAIIMNKLFILKLGTLQTGTNEFDSILDSGIPEFIFHFLDYLAQHWYET